MNLIILLISFILATGLSAAEPLTLENLCPWFNRAEGEEKFLVPIGNGQAIAATVVLTDLKNGGGAVLGRRRLHRICAYQQKTKEFKCVSAKDEGTLEMERTN